LRFGLALILFKNLEDILDLYIDLNRDLRYIFNINLNLDLYLYLDLDLDLDLDFFLEGNLNFSLFLEVITNLIGLWSLLNKFLINISFFTDK
jgi:hypothetical protein